MSAAPMEPGGGQPSLGQQALTWWRARTRRERQSLWVVGVVLGAYLGWSILVAPALRTVRESAAQIDELDAQYQQMQRVAAESAALRSASRVSPTDAVAALKSATERLGEHGKLALQGDRATLTLNAVSQPQLRAWLSEVRSGARARPIDSQLQHGPLGYSGTLSVSLGSAS